MDTSTTAFDLSDYQWQHRLLFVFAPSAKSPAFQQQMMLLEKTEAGFADRDLLLGQVLRQGACFLGEKRLDEMDGRHLRERFGIAEDHDQLVVILVGKDGTEKRRDTAPVAPEVIFADIDAMPMRQAEIRRAGQ